MRSPFVLVAAFLAVAAAGCGSASADPERSPTAAPSRAQGARTPGPPLPGRVSLYVDPSGHGPTEVTSLQAAGRTEEAAKLAPIAERPIAVWFTGQQPDPYAAAQDLTRKAAAAGAVPVVVVYNLPDRDCGQFSSGGAADVDAYLTWLGSVAAGFEQRQVIVILEPDAVPHALEGCAGRGGRDERFGLLAAAVDILKRQPSTSVYVDAGNAGWIRDVDELADALSASGVHSADGFSLNVSNFETDADSLDYGRRLSRRLDSANFVIDTSRNGSGPPGAGSGGGHTSWCNPPDRSLGRPPTTSTGTTGVDAFLWIKQPGDSDGDCRPGAPPAGAWWLDYALDLVD